MTKPFLVTNKFIIARSLRTKQSPGGDRGCGTKRHHLGQSYPGSAQGQDELVPGLREQSNIGERALGQGIQNLLEHTENLTFAIKFTGITGSLEQGRGAAACVLKKQSHWLLQGHRCEAGDGWR